MSTEAASPYLELPGFTIDVRRRVLLRRENGEAIALAAKVFDTLLYLAQHPGEVLEKDALLAAVWPGVVVEENSLAQNISALRQALGESHGENRYIATVPRRGYRFVAEVRGRNELPGVGVEAPVVVPTVVVPSKTPEPALPRDVARRWWIGAAALAVLVIGGASFWLAGSKKEVSGASSGAVPSLAVLPFKPLVVTERDESLELGMTDSLITKLSELDGHVVKPLSSVRRYGAPETDALAAARALDAQVVLDGSLQHSDGRAARDRAASRRERRASDLVRQLR